MDRASLRNNRDAVHKSPMTLVLRTTVTTACITRALLPSTVVNCNQLVLCVLVMCQYRLCRYRYDIDLSHRNIGDIDVSSILLSLAKQDSVGNSAIFYISRLLLFTPSSAHVLISTLYCVSTSGPVSIWMVDRVSDVISNR